MTAVELTSYPFDNEETREAQWTKFARTWDLSGVVANTSDEFEVYADSSGMKVKVKEGAVMILGHFGESSAEEELSISASHASYDRYDRVVARLDWANNKIELDVIEGTPSASPTVPVLTQNTSIHEIPLATILVEAAVVTIPATAVTDERVRVSRKIYPANFVIGSGQSVVLTGYAGHLLLPPIPLVAKRWKALAHQSGSIEVEVWACNFDDGLPTSGDKISASAPISITSATKNSDDDLSGWSTSLLGNEQDCKVLGFNVNSVTDIQQVTIYLELESYEIS